MKAFDIYKRAMRLLGYGDILNDEALRQRFEEQSAEYKESVLPKEVRRRVVVEALSDFGWGKYVGLDGAYVTMKSFGASGPAAKLFEKFGFTVENVVNTVKTLF